MRWGGSGGRRPDTLAHVTPREPHDRSPAAGGSRIRRGCEARGWRLLPRFAFMPKSVVAGSNPGTVWINVGTATGRGVINYRAPGSGVQGACESVVQRQTEILSHVFDEWDRPGNGGGPPSGVLEVTICVDAEFKPDDAVAAFLVLHLLEHGALPRCAAAMAAYMAWARRSSEPYFPAEAHDGGSDAIHRYLATLAASGDEALTPVTFGFALQCRNWAMRSPGMTSGATPKNDLASVLDALIEMSRAASVLLERQAATPGDRPWTDFPKDAHGLDSGLGNGWAASMPGDLGREIRAAATAVLGAAESMDARTCSGRLPIGPDLRDEELARVMVVSTGSRTDPERPGPDLHTTQLTRICIGAGLFDGKLQGPAAVLVLHGDNAGGGCWFDISLTADRRNSRARSLRGLGRALEELEQERRSAKRDARRALRGRFEDIPGIVDPWYDGRDHDYGIVGGPFSGSELTIEDVERLLNSAFWKPRVARAQAWTVSESSDSAPRKPTSPADEAGTNVYRRRMQSSARGPEGAPEKWAFQDAEKSPELRTHEFRLRCSDDHAPSSSATLRADTGVLAGAKATSADDSFRIITLDLLPPPFVAAERRITVADCVPELVRDQFRREFCGPVFRTIELDADSEADIGSDGIVVWRRPGAAVRDPDLGRSLALVSMDLLAYRSDLRRLLGAASELSVLDSPTRTFVKRWWHGRSAATYLIRFVDIVKNYRPERGRQDLRRACDALEEVLSVPSTIARLERFLQFSDERERILRDGMLQVSLLLLAIPVLFQTPADLMQAWPVWRESGGIESREAVDYLIAIGRIVLSTLVIVVGGFLLLRTMLRQLPAILRGRPPVD